MNSKNFHLSINIKNCLEQFNFFSSRSNQLTLGHSWSIELNSMSSSNRCLSAYHFCHNRKNTIFSTTTTHIARQGTTWTWTGHHGERTWFTPWHALPCANRYLTFLIILTGFYNFFQTSFISFVIILLGSPFQGHV